MKNQDPCFCISHCQGSYTSPCPPSGPKENCDCLFICNGAIGREELVGPCGASGFSDISSLAKSTCVCNTDLKYQVIDTYNKSMLTNVYLAGTLLHWTTVGSEPNRIAKVDILACCENKDGIVLEFYFEVEIYIADLCAGVKCPEKCGECDPCTGECGEASGEIKVSESMGGKISVK